MGLKWTLAALTLPDEWSPGRFTGGNGHGAGCAALDTDPRLMWRVRFVWLIMYVRPYPEDLPPRTPAPTPGLHFTTIFMQSHNGSVDTRYSMSMYNNIINATHTPHSNILDLYHKNGQAKGVVFKFNAAWSPVASGSPPHNEPKTT
jgi:hypothetical protein